MKTTLQIENYIKQINDLLLKYEPNFSHIPEENLIEREKAFLDQNELFREKGFEFANDVLINGEDFILKIKSELGEDNKIYRDICDKWVGMILTLAGCKINSYMIYTFASDLSSNQKDNLTNLNFEALSILMNITPYYIGPENFEYLVELRKLIKGIEKKINPSTSCYIATIIYKDYDSYEVSLLRQYRDLKLKSFFLGRIFISFYYFSNPVLYPIVKRSFMIQNIFKFILNHKIKNLKKIS
jgi:hypothetical protein